MSAGIPPVNTISDGHGDTVQDANEDNLFTVSDSHDNWLGFFILL